VRRLGVRSDQVLRIPNGHNVGSGVPTPTDDAAGDEGALGLEGQEPTLVWYTRFTEASPGRAAALLAPIMRRRPELRLTLLGDEIAEGSRYSLSAAFDALGIGGQVDWVSFDPLEVEKHLVGRRGSVVAIYPLDDDAVNRARSPSKLPQLMALGVPVVAEAVGEAPVYLDGFTQCLARPGDPDAFRRLVENLLDGSELRSNLGDRLKEAAKRWQWSCVAGPLLHWYESVLGVR
jgi:glycosyltransferase involved in cell wall biosynthesis